MAEKYEVFGYERVVFDFLEDLFKKGYIPDARIQSMELVSWTPTGGSPIKHNVLYCVTIYTGVVQPRFCRLWINVYLEVGSTQMIDPEVRAFLLLQSALDIDYRDEHQIGWMVSAGTKEQIGKLEHFSSVMGYSEELPPDLRAVYDVQQSEDNDVHIFPSCLDLSDVRFYKPIKLIAALSENPDGRLTLMPTQAAFLISNP